MLTQEEIDSLIASMSSGIDKAAVGAGNTATDDDTLLGKRNYKLYNFRRPDKFSKDHLRALQTIHEGFSRQLGLVLTGYLRMPVDIEVISVDQLTYDEFTHSMPGYMTVGILEMDPLPGQILMGFSHEITSGVIDRMLGGTGRADARPRELTDIEQQLIRRVIDRTVATMAEAWRSVVAINPLLVGMEDSYALIQVASPGEIVALITLQFSFGRQDFGLLSFCIPYPVLEGVIEQLSAQHIFHGHVGNATQEEQKRLLQRLGSAKIPVSVLLGGTRISIHDLVDLGEGDVIRLTQTVNHPLLVCINHQPKFLGRAGTRRKQLAVCVTDALTDIDVNNIKLLEGFGFHGR